jgi:bacillithiol biosynthesis cysteine-adding enzyme BshC
VIKCYTPGKTYSLAFRELMATYFAGHGLLFFEPEDEEAKTLGKELFISSVERQAEEDRLLGKRNKRIRELGLELQVAALEGETNLFLIEENGVRDKLVRSEKGFATKVRNERFTARELRELAEAEPARISFGVLLRPVFQQALFPVAAYLGGTSEAAYWAQMYPLFGLHGLPEPLLIPRPGFTLISRRAARLLNRYELELTDFLAPQHELLRRVSARAIPPTLARRISELQSVFASYTAEMRDDAVKLDEGLGGVLDTLAANFAKHLATVEKKAAQAAKRKDDLLVRHICELYDVLMPQGKLQERVLSALSAVNEFGTRVIDAVQEASEFPPSNHKAITL